MIFLSYDKFLVYLAFFDFVPVWVFTELIWYGLQFETGLSLSKSVFGIFFLSLYLFE